MERLYKTPNFQNSSRISSEEKKIILSFNADTYQPESFTHLRQNPFIANIRAHQTSYVSKIEAIKFKIQKSFFDNRWRQPGLQLPLPFHLPNEGLIHKMWEQKRHFFLCDLHRLFTKETVNYHEVYCAFNEFLVEHGLCAEFKECMTGPLELWIRCALEYSQYQDYPTYRNQ